MAGTTVNETTCEALFASPLQPSDALTAETVADAIGSTIRHLGAAGCAGQMAQEFGDHPEEATRRMRWVLQLIGAMCGDVYLPAALPPAAAASDTSLVPVRAAA